MTDPETPRGRRTCATAQPPAYAHSAPRASRAHVERIAAVARAPSLADSDGVEGWQLWGAPLRSTRPTSAPPSATARPAVTAADGEALPMSAARVEATRRQHLRRGPAKQQLRFSHKQRTMALRRMARPRTAAPSVVAAGPSGARGGGAQPEAGERAAPLAEGLFASGAALAVPRPTALAAATPAAVGHGTAARPSAPASAERVGARGAPSAGPRLYAGGGPLASPHPVRESPERPPRAEPRLRSGMFDRSRARPFESKARARGAARLLRGRPAAAPGPPASPAVAGVASAAAVSAAAAAVAVGVGGGGRPVLAPSAIPFVIDRARAVTAPPSARATASSADDALGGDSPQSARNFTVRVPSAPTAPRASARARAPSGDELRALTGGPRLSIMSLNSPTGEHRSRVPSLESAGEASAPVVTSPGRDSTPDTHKQVF